MAIGAKYGRNIADDDMAKEMTYSKMKQFENAFLAMHKGLNCHELLEKNVSKPNELDDIIQTNGFSIKCPLFVNSASQILEKLL